MIDGVISVLTFAGIASMAALPGAVVALIGMGRKLARLEERNAAQAQTIAGLQARLTAAGAGQRTPPAPPRGEWPAMRGDTFPSRAVTECGASGPPNGWLCRQPAGHDGQHVFQPSDQELATPIVATPGTAFGG